MSIAKLDGNRGWAWLRPLLWSGAGALLLVPLWAMNFASGLGFNWTLSDFIFAALLIGGVGLAFELALRVSPSWSYRAGAALGLAAGFLLIWANGAVGYIGSEDNPYNLAFFIVIAIAFAGALIAGFKANGMAWTMLAAGIAHAVAGFGGAAEDPRTIPITIVLVGMWLGSARLFHLSARA
jgi:hypothetical protein